MAAKVHSDEQIAQDLADYIEDTAQAIALAVREGKTTPNAPTLDRRTLLDYYRRALSTPEGVQQEVARIGPQGLAKVYAELSREG